MYYHQMATRMSIYRVVCESFETMDRVSDAVTCFHEMTTEMEARANSSNRDPEWASGEWSRIRLGSAA